MRQKSTKINNKIIIMAIITAFIVAISFSFSINTMISDELTIAIEHELDSALSYQKLAINEHNKNNMSQLKATSSYISNSVDNPDEIKLILNSQIQHSHMSELYFITPDAKGTSQSGERKDFSNNMAFNMVMQTQEAASSISDLSSIDEGIMDLAVPVIINGEIAGVVLGVNYVMPLLTELNKDLAEFSYVIVTNKDNEIVVSTSPETYTTFEHLEQNDVEFKQGGSLSNILIDMSHGIEGICEFTINSNTTIVKYMPLGIGDLTILIFAQSDQLETGIRSISTVMIYVSIISFLILAGLVIYVWAIKSKSITQFEKIAYYDELTTLPNLSKLKKDIYDILNKNKNKKYAIIKVDVTNFKSINETYGYQIGNKVLCAFKEIGAMVPEKTLIISRVGIDEFIFFAGNNFLEELDASTSYYESYFKKLIPELENHHLKFTYGRYFIDLGETDVDDIYTKVSLAHTMAREKKDFVIWDYDDNYKQRVLKDAALENKMYMALENQEFCAYLQPKFEIKTQKIIGAEALVRWIEPSGNIIFPNDFIPLFESNGFIIEIDMFILRSVCERLRQWKDGGNDFIPISVNFSRLHLETTNFVNNIISIVDEYNIPHKYIEIEVTETTALNNENSFRNFIEKLHDSGFKISIDDFGTGYSSLGLLKDFKMDILKLDRSFIAETLENERKELIVDGIIKMAHSLDMSIVAEGVEDDEQVEFLSSINCEAAQGYFYAKPMPINEFEQKFIVIQ